MPMTWVWRGYLSSGRIYLSLKALPDFAKQNHGMKPVSRSKTEIPSDGVG